jgi:NAD(P)-dependent dehydrogenase (short-subunit alcohol dehydrogenase family)
MSGVLAGKTSFITGGIGQAICERFAREGAEVIAADLNQSAVEIAGVEYMEYDVTNEGTVIATFEQLAKKWYKLDI